MGMIKALKKSVLIIKRLTAQLESSLRERSQKIGSLTERSNMQNHTGSRDQHELSEAVELASEESDMEKPEMVSTEELNTKRPEAEAREAVRKITVLSDIVSQPEKDVSPNVNEAKGYYQMPGFGMFFHLYECDKEQRREGDCDIIFPQSVYRRVLAHLKSDTSREHGGLLLGREVYHTNSDRKTVLITGSLPAKQEEGGYSEIIFTHETWAEFNRETDQIKTYDPDIKRVGWYHSHPTFGVFLSEPDLNFCEVFRHPTSIALVVDPIADKGGFFVRGNEGYRRDRPQGFWELHDLKKESIVTWKNMIPINLNVNMPDSQGPSGVTGADRTVLQSYENPRGVTRPGQDDPEKFIALSTTSPETRGQGWRPGQNSPESFTAGHGRPNSRVSIPPYVFILVVLVFPCLLAYAAVRSFGANSDSSSMQTLESKVRVQEESMKLQSERLENIEKTLEQIKENQRPTAQDPPPANEERATRAPVAREKPKVDKPRVPKVAPPPVQAGRPEQGMGNSGGLRNSPAQTQSPPGALHNPAAASANRSITAPGRSNANVPPNPTSPKNRNSP